ILDEGLVCHLGFVHDGHPFVLPTTYARVDDALYLHGSAASRMLRGLRDGIPVCVTVTLLDGLVLARSAFHHSMNYRSVVILGVATEVTDGAERLQALEAIVEHVNPGRWAQVRPPNERELKATMVLRLPIAEASAKIRTGRLLDLLHPDVRLIQPIFPPTLGRAAAEARLFRPLFRFMPDMRLAVVHWSAAGDAVFIEWTATATVGGRPLRWSGVDRFLLVE